MSDPQQPTAATGRGSIITKTRKIANQRISSPSGLLEPVKEHNDFGHLPAGIGLVSACRGIGNAGKSQNQQDRGETAHAFEYRRWSAD
jgi:hypothetical protein